MPVHLGHNVDAFGRILLRHNKISKILYLKLCSSINSVIAYFLSCHFKLV